MNANSVTADPDTEGLYAVCPSWSAVDAAALAAGGMPPRVLRKVLARFDGLAAYMNASPDELHGAGVAFKTAPSDFVAPSDGFVTFLGDADYPKFLAARETCPPVLVMVGDRSRLTILDRAGVAVVGSRRMSSLGATTAPAAVAGALACQAPVVSGMADGVDQCAHDAAIGLGLPTVGVAGSSLDRLSGSTAAAADRIVGAGGLVMSHVVTPRTERAAQHLHARNFVIAQLSSVLVPCEGRLSSGTTSAVRAALTVGSSLVVPLPRESHRNAPGAQLLVELADEFPRLDRLGISGSLAAKVARRHPIADAVAHDRDGLANLVELAWRFAAA